MYIFIDEQYRISKSSILSGHNYSLAKQGKLSVISVPALRGMNIDGTWSDIQEEPEYEPRNSI